MAGQGQALGWYVSFLFHTFEDVRFAMALSLAFVKLVLGTWPLGYPNRKYVVVNIEGNSLKGCLNASANHR